MPHNRLMQPPTPRPETTLAAGALLALDDIAFLREILRRYPEMLCLAGPAEASPEGTPRLKPGALAYQVFPAGIAVDPAAIEADRTFVGLLALKWVLAGEEARFTAAQPAPEKLTAASFAKLRDYTQGVVAGDEDLEFCLYSIACNDLGKTAVMAKHHREGTGGAAEDHDQLLTTLVARAPNLFPALRRRLTPQQQQSYLAGLQANFNLGQFVQGENLPAQLVALQALDAKSRALRLLCEVFDFAGAAGHVEPRGSLTMTENNYRAFAGAIEALSRRPALEAYQQYIAQRGALADIDATTPVGFALARLAALARAFDAAAGADIKAGFAALPADMRAVLVRGLNATGLDGDTGVIIYYAPALVANAQAATGSLRAALGHALPLLAAAYAEGDRADAGATSTITISVADAARQALTLKQKEADMAADGNDNLDMPGTRLAFIGGGGGSDCIQAAILGLLSGKPACAISVRTEKTQSQGASGVIGDRRRVEGHGGEIAPGVYRILPGSSGSGRFLEHIPAALLPMYLVVDAGDGRLQAQLQAALDDFGGVDGVIDVDTGGDCLYRSGIETASDKATPDQDLATLRAVRGLKAKHLLSCVIAKGVDSPEDADAVLAAAKAKPIAFSPAQKQRILTLYKTFELDGSNPARYGKTPFAWQAALRGETGPVRLPLPDSVVNDPKNPWNPMVTITQEMAGGYLMTVEDHLRAISAQI